MKNKVERYDTKTSNKNTWNKKDIEEFGFARTELRKQGASLF